MPAGYALSGICNPMYGLGTLGLGAGSTYSSYYPYTTGMYGGYGMDNIFNMYQSMQNVQQNMEISNANHTNTMNGIMNNNEVSAVGNAQSALVSKIMQNGSIMTLLGNLIDKVHKGELDGVCKQYNDLKNQIYSTYRDEIAARGKKENPERTVREIIDTLYTQKMASCGFPGASLRDDIKNNGDSAFMNGYLQSSKPGHGKKYVEEALYDIYHEDIDNQQSNESARSIGMFAGGLANAGKKSLTYGGTAAVVSTGVVGIIKGCFALAGQGNKFEFLKWAGRGLKGSGYLALGILAIGLLKAAFNGGKNEVKNRLN